jgi:uncharacterized protein (DUF1800 family)
MIAPMHPRNWDRACAAHLLRRTTFGAPPGEIERFHRMGLAAAVAALIDAEEDAYVFPLPPELEDFKAFETLRAELFAVRKDATKRVEAQRALQRAERAAIESLRGWWLRRMRFSTHPLREMMTLFWHGHFTSGMQKVRSAQDMAFQNETFRIHALGNFRTLAAAMPVDLAMMRYLDIIGSSKQKPNENFARELMELFLLGEGNYSEEDIRSAARAFTGYRLNRLKGIAVFEQNRADTTPISLMGKQGIQGPEGVVGTIVEHRACAPYIAGRIWRFFTDREPTRRQSHAWGEVFRGSGFNTARLLTAIFTSSEFYDENIRGSQIRSPVHWLVGTAKALEVPLAGDRTERGALRTLGQELFEPPNVKGWEGGRSWIGASTFLARCNLAGQLFLKGDHARKPDPSALAPKTIRNNAPALCDHLAARLLAVRVNAETRSALISAAMERGLPATDQTIFELLGLIMASPEYQLT